MSVAQLACPAQQVHPRRQAAGKCRSRADSSSLNLHITNPNVTQNPALGARHFVCVSPHAAHIITATLTLGKVLWQDEAPSESL